MSWYRKYRPQKVNELKIKPAREAFQRILDTGNFSHAYLLSGPKGTGKTSGARILAKVLNCELNRKAIEKHQPFVEPCNVCSSCISITNGSSMTVVEMDAASNRGIDDIREIRDRIGLSPSDGVVCVYIIDEVHMLTTEAFNALLKILEEPPAHVVFVLATTDPQKVPATVLSRCTHISYRRATNGEVVETLETVAAAENMAVEKEVLAQFAIASDGSFRDAIKFFEQVASGKTTLTLADIEFTVFNNSDESVQLLATALQERSLEKTQKLFSKFELQSVDFSLLHKRLLTSLMPKSLELVRALNIPLDPLLPIPWLPFYLGCVEWCMQSPQVPVRSAQMVKEIPIVQPTSKLETSKPVTGPVPGYSEITAKWPELLRKVHSRNTSVEALLRSTKLVGIDGNTLQLEAFYAFHKEQLEAERNRRIFEGILAEIFSCKLIYSLSLSQKAKLAQLNPNSNVSGKVEDEGMVTAAEEAFL